MLNLKKYGNGRYYDIDRKKYVLKADLKALIRRGRKVRVVSTRSGEDITAAVVAELGGRPQAAPTTTSPAGGLTAWVRENKARLNDQIDGRIDRMLEALNLPTREQVVQLTTGITALTEKIRELEALQAPRADEPVPVPAQDAPAADGVEPPADPAAEAPAG